MDLAVAGFAALVVGLLLPAIGLYESKGWDRGALQLYQQLANEAVDKRDGAAAGTYLRKLQALNEHGSETRYVTARLAEMNGQSNDVERLMHELRRWRDGVILPAHFWVATRLLRRARPIFSGTDHAARSSPQCGAGVRPRSAGGPYSVGGYRAAARQPGSSRQASGGRGSGSARDACGLGSHLLGIGRRVSGRGRSGACGRALPTGIVPGCGQHRRGQSLGQGVGCGRRFRAGRESVPRRAQNQQPAESPETKQRVEALNRRLADHYVEWSDHLAKNQSDVKRRIELLQKTLAAVPEHVGALNRLALLAAQAGPKDDSVRNQVSQVLAGQDIPALGC